MDCRLRGAGGLKLFPHLRIAQKVPRETWDEAVAALAAPFGRVVVECHPAFLGGGPMRRPHPPVTASRAFSKPARMGAVAIPVGEVHPYGRCLRPVTAVGGWLGHASTSRLRPASSTKRSVFIERIV